MPQEKKSKAEEPELKEEDAPEAEATEPESEVIPLQDIFSLIDAKVADQVGAMEEEKEPTITLDDVQAAIAKQEPVVQETGVDAAEIKADMEVLETKLKEEAKGEFIKVQTAVGNLAEAGKAKAAEVEAGVEAKVAQVLKLGLSKISETEKKVAESANQEINQAKQDAVIYLDNRLEGFKQKDLKPLIRAEIEAYFEDHSN